MARPKKVKKEVTSPKKSSPKKSGILSQIKWGESYTSLILGIIVVIIAAVLAFSFLKARNAVNQDVTSTETKEETQINKQGKKLPKTYNVKEGEHLWSISQSVFGSGYNWVDIAKENNLTSPEVVYVGMKLKIPNVDTKEVSKETTVQTNSISQTTYKVQEGDFLWDIAVRSYGDGFKWVEIAKANNLVNPDYIEVGQVLNLPR